MWSAPLLAPLLGLAVGTDLRLEVTIDPGPRDVAAHQVLLHVRAGDGLPEGWSIAAARPAGFDARFVEADAPSVAVDPARGGEGIVDGLHVTWHEPALAAGEPRTRVLVLERAADGSGESFSLAVDDETGERQVRYGLEAVLTEVRAFDVERFEETYKIYDHLHGFAGERLTKPHGGLYPHHRGVFLGWAKTRHAGTTHNFWHNPNDARATQRGKTTTTSLGRSHYRALTRTDWIATDGTLIATDERDLTVLRPCQGECVFDYLLRVHAPAGELVLDGDPPHAGFQFRAAQEVAERKDCVYLLPEGAESRGNDNWANARWVAARFSIGGKPVTVVHMEHPGNPGATIWNTRNYGRFGAFARHEVATDAPLELRYRILVREDPPERAQLDAAWRAWVQPPVVRVRVL